jgi:hypothetical protein
MTGDWRRSKWFSELRKPVWMGFLLSSPALALVLAFFAWPEPLPNALFNSFLGYVAFSFLVMLISLIRNPIGQIVPVIVVAGAVSIMAELLPFVNWLGFQFCVYPMASYIKNHCNPVGFKQDGKTYFVGLCDMSIDPDSDGQIDFAFLYDTSGDILNDADAKALNHSLDRREWVNAIRAATNDDPNELFEFANFWTDRLYNSFYEVTFDDDQEQGFTKEYGPPPSNPKNPYPPMF